MTTPTATGTKRARRVEPPSDAATAKSIEPGARDPLSLGVRALLERGRGGRYEGEMRWCAMLSAQYVLAHHVTGRAIPAARRAQLLRYFQRSCDARGL